MNDINNYQEQWKNLNSKEMNEHLDVLSFLVRNYFEFPKEVPCGYDKFISFDIYKNFKWIKTPEGEIIFGNCYIPGITKAEFDSYKPIRLH